MHVYIHVPFCARRCSYCDFSIAVRRDVPSDRYAEAIVREWVGWQRHPVWEVSPVVETVYLGGGTPSRIAPAAIARILGAVAGERQLAGGAEITLEANPDDVTPRHAAEWRAAGVTRVSLGIQSFNPGVLAWMHRTHTAEQARAAVRVLRAAGFGELSLDLIFGLPDTLGRDWAADLDCALALEPEHLSLYGLTVEEHTPLGRWTGRGEVVPIDEERYATEFLAAHARLYASGYEHYEVSNAARPGRRARHNSAYWRRAPFVGLGPSAHSGFGANRQWNLHAWAAYERAVFTGTDPVAGRETLTAGAIRLEDVYLGLRTADGVRAALLPADTIQQWCNAGWAWAQAGRVRLTPEGWLRLDALVAAAA